MAISTYKTFLMKGTGGAWSKLIDIKEFPDLGGVPEMLDTTTMSDGARTYILGIQETEAMTFTANYTLADYVAIKALENVEQDFAVWLGATVENEIATPTGVDGKFEFKGYITVTKTGGGVNEVQNMTITIAPTTVIRQTAGTTETPSVTLDVHALTLGVSDTYTFNTVTVPAGKTVTYTSSATAKASVNSAGKVTAAQAGSTIITATITDGGVDYTDTCTVVVE
jgi:hypothetical protein